MRARYEIWVSDARGNRIRLAANLSDFAIARALNSAGEFWINLPPNFDMTLVPLDNLVEFWRASESGPLSLFCVGIIKERERWTRGRRIAEPDQMDILHSRIIAYPAGHANTEITDQYDDMMKAIMRALPVPA